MKITLLILLSILMLSCNNEYRCNLACSENAHYTDKTECGCECNDGYYLSPNEFDCIKKETDLCINKQCQANATCNSDNGNCICNENYHLSDNNTECIKNEVKTWYKPNTKTTWQWQLTGEINSSYDVDLYDIDLFDNSKELIKLLQDDGKKVICYFSAGSYENWRPDKDLFTSEDYSIKLDGWAGERWLDIRRENVKTIMKKRLDLAVEKGCDGVEPDNVDGYTNNTGIDLKYDDQIEYNTFLSLEAHKRNLSIALKNDLDQVNDLVDLFDFSINEQCHQYNECDMLKPFTTNNKPIFNAEYADKYKSDEKNKLCDSSQSNNIKIKLF